MQKCYATFIMLLTGCFGIFFVTPCLAALENLDAMEDRITRKASNSFYSGESSSNDFLWQPMTLFYTDVATGHEVWVMTKTDNATAYSGSEYGHQPWSADGKWFSIAMDKDTVAFTRGSFYADDVWFTVKSNGSGMRPRVDSPARIRTHSAYTQWSPVELDVYFEFGRAYAGESGFDVNMLYKVTVTDNGITTAPWIDFISGNTGTQRDMPKDAVSSDGKYVLATEYAEMGVVAIGDTASNSLKLPEYDMDRGVDTYWNNLPSGQDDWHDEMFVGAGDNYWVYYLFTSGAWTRMRPWGTDGGAPNHTADQSTPYDWWVGTDGQKEIQPVNGSGGNRAFTNNYWSHGVPDRWGNHFAYSDTQGAYVAPGVYDIDADVRTAFPSSVKGAQYHAWTGWTDHTTGTDGANNIYYMKYDDGESHEHVASIHASVYTMFTKPGQSPDGTKTAFRSGFLQPTTSNADVFVVVTEYPHPPEIESVTGNGTYTVRFSWRLDSAIPRGYTNRGWPNEATDNPPAPRETKSFRLWRSANGTSSWEPVKIIAASPFSKFDYVNGGVKNGQVAYWEITDTPGDGTWYYAVTSIEHSGLESRTLSNVFSSTGSQSATYPAKPGGVSQFYFDFPPSPVLGYEKMATPGHYQLTWNGLLDPMIRYYNIYYSTISLPEPIQQNRIASIPVGTSSYLDWLADPSVDGYYTITSVDYQGNESSAGIGVDDTEPPTAPAGLSAISITSNQVNLAWNASTDNIVVVGYKIYRDGTEVSSSSSTSFIDTELIASTDYAYAVAAYDASGNYSPLSQSVSVTTEAVQEVLTMMLVDVGESVKYFKGTESPGSDWNQLVYDDSSWLSGVTGIGYGDGDDATILSDMQGSYLTVFLRKSFSLTDTEGITSMQLSLDFDDGFVAYLNGQEIARNNVSGTPTYDMPSSGYNEAGTPLVIDVSNFTVLLQNGTNVLSVVGHNGDLISSDFSLIPRLEIDYIDTPSVVKDFILVQ